jgi:mannose-6-phosphate isomerase-like protein (cupin superfamily)
MADVITGRRLEADGQPVERTGFAYDSQGALAELLAQRVSPVYSQPITGEWIFAVVRGEDTGGEFERGVGVFPPGNAGPPAHIHPGYDERFEIIQGEFVFTIDGKDVRFGPGDRSVASMRSTHTFRCVGDQVGAVIAETRPAARTGDVIATLFGMAHAGLLNRRGHPSRCRPSSSAASTPMTR